MDNETEELLTRKILSELDEKALKEETGRFVFQDPSLLDDNLYQMWSVTPRHKLFETTIEVEGFEDVEVHVTYVNVDFFRDVLSGDKDVPLWQVATVHRLLKNAKIVTDTQGMLAEFKSQVGNVQWSPNLVRSKKMAALELLGKASKCLKEDMLADAYFWALKGAEEAVCVPLMAKNKFGVATPILLLDSLRETEPDFYEFFVSIMGVSNFKPEDVLKALEEAERLGNFLYHKSVGTPREMWVLAAFVSINESERRIKQCQRTFERRQPSEDIQRLLEGAVAELWQAVFLMAQNPRDKLNPLDPQVIGLFWKWFVRDATEEDVFAILDSIEALV